MWAAYALLFYKELAEDLVNYRCDVAINLVCLFFNKFQFSV